MQLRTWSAAALALAITVGLQGCAGTQPIAYADGAAPAPLATPAAGAQQPFFHAQTQAEFTALQAEIQKQMQPGGRWQFVDARQHATIDSRFAAMDKLFSQYGSVDKMDGQSKAKLVEDQSDINAILTQNDGQRMICQMERPVGTNIPVRKCRSYAEIEQQQRQTREAIRTLGIESGGQAPKSNNP